MEGNGTGPFAFDARDAAALRRGVDPWEVHGFYALLKHYRERGYSPNFLAMAAPVLAEIRSHDDERLGVLCRKARLSEKRFRRLLSARDREDLARQLRAVVRILRRTANPDDIVQNIVFWGEQRRRRLAQEYFRDDDDG